MSETALLDGKVAIVTGAGRGVGREIALLMAKKGARVVVNDLGGTGGGEGENALPATETVNEIKAAGGEAVANFDSVADFKAAQGMVDQAVDTFGKLDIIVNNAGIVRDAIFHKMTEEEWDQVISVHLKGAFNISRAAATLFRQQQSGRMIHMTSTSGLIGNFGQANYSAAKLGMVGLSRSIALDMARYNVTSNAIGPFAWSRLIGTIPIKSEADRARVERFKTMTPAKVAPLATALASDAAQDITGQIFVSRGSEVMLFNQPRPLRAMARPDGWTVEDILEHAFPAFSSSLVPLERSSDVLCWDPV
ncbi:SDR family NAD(P)-dependent oxidoreductase [Roseibium sp. RKSG952]|uniref:SDR family NAD(P)-dependent oxidoreductase n=1 Tax=Roseibium sp. RKSG952 TaxID=2529384 RepID=UPI0012BB9A60|nr:SDR family NAD(P)-dependent oxidoreductase [Roseibium sp. RKSG952]MTH96196.1 SDR family NAD(P)-dependent oxidoreductase [Roseibium sp. RKSG952]